MKEKIFNNISLKILSIICAIVLWGLIVNIYDPTTGFTISGVTVQLVNTDNLSSQGYTYDVVDGSKISVYVSGPTSVITDIKASDIVATADLGTISAFADYVDIDVKVVKDGRTLQNVEVTPKTTAIKLNIESSVTQSFDVGIETVGKSNYVLINQNVSPAFIKVKGPKSELANVAQAKAVYDISGATSNISDTASIVLLDNDGNEINNSELQLSQSTVTFSATLGLSKTVEVHYSTSGNPSSGYSVSKIEPSVSQVTLLGEASTIEGLTSLEIPSSVLNVDGANADKNFRIWLSDYVPAGVTVSSDNFVNVDVKISGEYSKKLSIKSSDIQINNLDSGLTAEIVSPKSTDVTLYGNPDLISKITVSDIKPYINLSGQTEGNKEVRLELQSIDGVSVNDSIMVTVSLKKKESTQQQVDNNTVVQQETTTVSN